MHTLTVELAATYLVGAGQWVVHNLDDWPFDIIGKTLLLGEGDFGFSSSIAELVSPAQASLLIATDYWTERVPGDPRFNQFLNNVEFLDRVGAKVMTDVDATNLRAVFPDRIFDTIIWNFPHRGGLPQENIPMLKGFYQSANDVLAAKGHLYTILSSSPPYN